MGWISESIDSIKSLQIRQLLTQAVSLGNPFNHYSHKNTEFYII